MGQDVAGEDCFEIDLDALERRYEAERRKRLRAVGEEKGAEPMLSGNFANFDRDPFAQHALSRDAVDEVVDVLIIGGGMGGILSSAHLRDKGITDIRIVEKGADFGGTWYWNRYPGAACDVESYIYLPMLEATGYMPTERYSRSPEIRNYLRDLADRLELRSRAFFQTVATELDWQEDCARWIVRTDRGDRIAARIVISCAGVLSNPKLPKISGIERFQGQGFHTSRWDFAYTGGSETGKLDGLSDKRVGIIGTGATALQVVPHLAESAKKLFIFQRTPSSVDERGNRATDPEWFASISVEPGWQARRQENFTSILSGMSVAVDQVQDGWTEIVRALGEPVGGEEDPRAAGFRKMELARRRIDQVVHDKATAEALKPYYHYFCKRPGFHDEYLESFNRDNVTLVDTKGEGVEAITERGVVVDGREYPLDCIIYSTGFDLNMEYRRETGFEVHGRDGVTLSEHWREGPRTLYAVQTDGFPNFFFLRIAQAGHSPNYTLTVDEQSRYVVDIIARTFDQGAATVEATGEAVDEWVATVVEKGEPRQMFLRSCTPGQYNYEGDEDRARFASLNDLYGGGAIEYFSILRERRARGDLMGLKFT